jgi:hypothetical protein
MMSNKILAALAVIPAFLLGAPVHAEAVSGQITGFEAASNDPNPCTLFEIGSAAPMYAVSSSTPGYAQIFALLMAAAMSGQKITFVPGRNVNCGSNAFASANGIFVGTLH